MHLHLEAERPMLGIQLGHSPASFTEAELLSQTHPETVWLACLASAPKLMWVSGEGIRSAVLTPAEQALLPSQPSPQPLRHQLGMR